MQISQKLYWSAGVAVVALFAGGGALAQVRAFNIPAASAVKTIPQFAAQAGVQIGAPAGQLDGVRTRAVQGNLDTRLALKQLLEGTNLEVAQDTGAVISLRIKAAPASADQGDASGPVNDGGRDEEVQAVVVTAIRKAYADAVNDKKHAVEISDGISADGLEKLPDLNLGEALQRLPGVQINRTEENRDATLSVRGLPGEYALATINGVIYATPIVLNSNPFGAYLSDIFNGARIDKTPMANVQSGGIAGRIDMQIGDALASRDIRTLKLSYEYNELGKLGAPGYALRWNHHFSDDLAVNFNLAYQRQNFRRDEIQSIYSTLTPTNTPNFTANYADYYAGSCVGSTATYCAATPTGTGGKATTGILYLSQARQYTRVNKGETLSMSGSVEYRFRENLKAGLSGFFSNKNMDGTHQYFAVTTLSGTGTTIIPRTAPKRLADGRWLVEDIDFQNPDVWMSTREYYTRARAGGLFGAIDWTPGEWKIKSALSRSKSSAYFLEQQYDFETLNYADAGVGGAGNGITGRINTGGGNLGDFVYTVTPPAGQSTLVYAQPASGSWLWGGGANPTVFYDGATANNSQRSLRFTGSPSYGRQAVTAIKLSAERPFAKAFVFAAGIDYSKVAFISEAYRTSAYGAQVQNLTQAMIKPSPFSSSFFDGKAGSSLQYWTISDSAYLSAVKPIAVYPGGDLSPLGYNIAYNQDSYARYNFTYANEVSAGFVQGKYDTSLLGVAVRGNVGLRFESFQADTDALTKVSSAGGALGAPSDFKLAHFKSKQEYVLPSAIVVVNLTDDFVVRAAAYRSYAQPLIRQNSPVTVVGSPTIDTAGDTQVSLSLGNPNLKPYTADSYDLSFEWYNRPGSVVSLALYRKKVKGFISAETDRSALCPADGSPYGLGTLTWDSSVGRCLSSLAGPGQTYVVNASGFRNYEQPLNVKGYELNIQQTFDFLPQPFDKLGAVFNYAHTKASGSINNALITLSGVAPQTINWITYYETKRWGVRATYSWRDRYVPSTYYTGSGARMVEAREQWDLSATYNLNDRFSLQFSGFNLTNAQVYQFENQRELPRIRDLDGRTYVVTLKGAF